MESRTKLRTRFNRKIFHRFPKLKTAYLIRKIQLSFRVRITRLNPSTEQTMPNRPRLAVRPIFSFALIRWFYAEETDLKFFKRSNVNKQNLQPQAW